MDTKRKLIISLASVGVVAIVAIVSLVIVLAAFTTTINNQFSVSYTANGVACTITAEYRVANVGETNAGSYTNLGSVTFGGKETGDAATKTITQLSQQTISKDQYFVIRYKIANTATNSVPMTLSLGNSTSTTSTNCTIKYAYSTSDISTNLATNGSSFSTSLSGKSIAKNVTGYAFILIQVTNFDVDAAYSGTVNWTLAAS
ncbi:MAG: hypothetical protein IKC79_00940 [Clostridia bacterium]|nr:hypothetical protein [Clostridia bacterium]